MAKRTINVNIFSQSSIDSAIAQLRSYEQEIKTKTQIFVQRLGEQGIEVINEIMESVPDEERGTYDTEIVFNSTGDITGAAVRLSGDKVLFIEFSAGVKYGSNDYPLPIGGKYGLGSYPGQTHAYDKWGWWYIDENGEKHHSYGVRAYMPMYNAERAIIMQVSTIAREVFG